MTALASSPESSDDSVHPGALAALAVGALGIVYGDIGTAVVAY